MIENKFEFGDGIAVRSNSFLSRGIRFFMRIYNPKVEDFSHNAVVVDIWGEPWVVEALAWGVRVWPLEKSGYITNKNVVILRHKDGFNDSQIKALSKKAVALGGTRYQYEGLPTWILKIIFKINVFKKESEKAIYCSELLAIALNAAYPGMYQEPNIINPADFMTDSRIIKLDPNNIL